MLILTRLCSNAHRVQGVLIHDRKILCHTLELPFLGNIQNKSCIPEGEYPCIKAESPKFGSCILLKNTAPRSSILIHPGNSIRDTRGCILPGLYFEDDFIVASRVAMDRILRAVPSSFNLIVRS